MKAPQQKSHNISWPDVYFTAEANRERFEDVNIVTLKSHLTEQAYDQAIHEVGISNETKLRHRVNTILNSGQLRVTEHVEVRQDSIRVVVDCENIDDETVWVALDMVASALDKLQGKLGTVNFSGFKSYTVSDITWLNVH